MRIAIDIGGVLSKYPDIFRPLLKLIINEGSSYDVELYILSDMEPHEKAIAYCHDNGFDIDRERILLADYDKYGEACKAEACKQHNIDILIDDFVGYVSVVGSPPVRLLLMPDTTRPYYDESWKMNDDSDHRNPPGSKRPPEHREG